MGMCGEAFGIGRRGSGEEWVWGGMGVERHVCVEMYGEVCRGWGGCPGGKAAVEKCSGVAV